MAFRVILTQILVYVVDQKGIEILDKFENPDTDSDYQKVRIDVILLNKFLTSHTGDQVSFKSSPDWILFPVARWILFPDFVD